MEKKDSSRECIEPRLLSLLDKSEEMPWLFVNRLQEGDTLEVQTKNTLYTMLVMEPTEGKVLANSNGLHIKQETETIVAGTTLTGTGTMVKVGGITIGLQLVLFAKGIGELVLSATKEVRVNGVQVLPVNQN